MQILSSIVRFPTQLNHLRERLSSNLRFFMALRRQILFIKDLGEFPTLEPFYENFILVLLNDLETKVSE